jgi:hypothetical protein
MNNLHNTCDPPPILKDVLDKKQLQYNSNKDDDYYIPCTYDTCEEDIRRIATSNVSTQKKLFLIEGCDVLASKLDLWRKLKNKFGEDADKYMPRTYLLEEDKGFEEHFKNNKNKRSDQMYVLKNYKQRQEGIKLTRNLQEIQDGVKNGWFLVQDYVYNPYIIANRKINFRYYLLIVCHNNNIDAYVFDDGFVYYTPEFYDDKSDSFDKHITTGYIDRKVYDENPLTLQDFRKHLENKKPGSSQIWDASALGLLKNVMKALDGEICNNEKLHPYLRFQLFGCDLAPDKNLGVKLMEINKGPDIGAKDERDKKVKKKLQEDILYIIENKTSEGTHFTKIY